MTKYGLKGPHATYLTTLYRYEEGVTAPQLCELCGKDKSDVSRMVSILEEKGLVTKEVVNQSLYRGIFKLTQCIIAFGGTTTKETRRYAQKVVKLIFRNIEILCIRYRSL